MGSPPDFLSLFSLSLSQLSVFPLWFCELVHVELPCGPFGTYPCLSCFWHATQAVFCCCPIKTKTKRESYEKCQNNIARNRRCAGGCIDCPTSLRVVVQ